MELTLTPQQGAQVAVICDGQPSHTFDLSTLVPIGKEGPSHFLDDPRGYGRAVYQALFPPGSLARLGLGQLSTTFPARLLLVPTDSLLDAIRWEYVYGPFGEDDSRDPERFLVCACHFVRGLPAQQRNPVPKRKRSLHLIAVPSDPLGHEIIPLDIESEWMRLKEIMQELPYALTLERTRPSTVERVRQMLANQQGGVLHFMGHGGQDEQGTFLCFEQDNGALKKVRAAELIGRVRGTVFLVTLNACVSAAPELTVFGNLAAALVQQKVPYALGMRLSIVDADARTFSRTFYSELARGSSVEEALFQARLSLTDSLRPWVIGVPVLYTALEAPSPGFAPRKGTPTINAHPPRLDVSALPPVDGTFQGRIDELVALGTDLTGDARPRIITIHGSGGQGKTALALKAAERFAGAWTGGVWAKPLEHLPDRATFVTSLARFLDIQTQQGADPNTQQVLDPHRVEQAVLTRLQDRRTLIVLDNAETLVEAVKKNDATALHLVEFLKKLPGPSVSLLVTSRDWLGWSGERTYELWGLSSQEGAALFLQCVTDPHHAGAVTFVQAQQLSKKLDGHPLGLRLLGGAFNGGALAFDAFLKTYEEQLVKAKDIYVGEEHRHYQLYTCIEVSVRALSSELRSLLSGLWVFHAPFLEDTAVAIFDPEAQETEQTPSPVRDGLHALWQRSLLTHRTLTLRDGTLPLYSLLPTTRPYIEHHLEPAYDRETIQARFGAAYLQIARWIYHELNRSTAAVTFAQQAREDLERGREWVTDREQGDYLCYWGRIMHRLGDPVRGLQFLERALEVAQGVDLDLELQVLNNMALVHSEIGHPQEALKLFEQALSLTREVGDRAGEATTLTNMAMVYKDTGHLREAFRLLEQALPIRREVGDRAGEATTLNNMAGIYRDTGRPQEALKLFEQSVQLAEQVANPAYQVAALVGLGQLLYRYLNLPAEAITSLEQAISLLQATGLPQDAAGHTIEQLQQALVAMRAGIFPRAGGPSTLPSAHIQQIVSNTLAVMTMAQDHLSDWREQMREALRDAQHRGTDWQIEADFFTAVLDILDGRSPILPADHPYAQAVTAIEQGIAAGGPERVSVSDEVMQAIREFVNSEDWDSARRVVEARRELLFRPEVEAFFEQNIEQAKAAGEERAIRLLELHLTVLRECKTQGIAQTFERLAARREQEHLPFDAELIPRSIKALLGGPQEKMEPAQYLAALSAQATDEQLKALIHAIQLALFGGDRSRLGQNLEGVYRRAWEAIVVGVETEGVDPRLFEAIVRHTLAVLGSDANRQSEWRKNLLQMRDQATTGGAKQLVALLDAVLGLLDAGGNPTGLGAGLTGIYEQIWKELVSHLHHQE